MNINAFNAFFIMNTHLTILFTLQRTAYHFKHYILRPIAQWISRTLARFNLTTPKWVKKIMKITLPLIKGGPLVIDDIDKASFSVIKINRPPGFQIVCDYNENPYYPSYIDALAYLSDESKSQINALKNQYNSIKKSHKRNEREI